MYTFVIENVHFFEILRVYVFIAKIITFMINGAFRRRVGRINTFYICIYYLTLNQFQSDLPMYFIIPRLIYILYFTF